MDSVPELQATLGKEVSPLLASIEERLSMLRACRLTSEVLGELELLVQQIRGHLRLP